MHERIQKHLALICITKEMTVIFLCSHYGALGLWTNQRAGFWILDLSEAFPPSLSLPHSGGLFSLSWFVINWVSKNEQVINNNKVPLNKWLHWWFDSETNLLHDPSEELRNAFQLLYKILTESAVEIPNSIFFFSFRNLSKVSQEHPSSRCRHRMLSASPFKPSYHLKNGEANENVI